jgi:REP-associated tyrosine transposase
MSLPRRVLPGRTYLITRRCSERRFFLRPSKRCRQALLFCLAEAARRSGVQICALLVMSNHYHAVIHDPHGRHPRFTEHAHKLIAKTMNAQLGRWEALWASEPCSVVECVDATDAFDKLIYTLTNPVNDDLVERATDWPGLTSLTAQLRDRTMTARRPLSFFAKHGRLPPSATLVLHRLPGFEHLSQTQWADKIRSAVSRVERQAAAKRARSGRRLKGRKAVLRDSPHDRPTTHAPRKTLSPRIAARNKWRRIEALRRNAQFQRDYRAAFHARRAGNLAAIFPAGSYQLRILGLVTCIPPA